ncbi:uncharacterized protein EV420DRAFT_1655610 [Desarmillaria tabescens]|uniref:Uncharacterized protein n=1 Tax=Armillaria tabescens TaxID=1929756 RepID=A0AA39IZL5_ARMTA|nr:uncharacterized protein EV420DRAFT_1655610 [Desarmillaria tabescens]KAK0432477.1 hypothetical protein EV420DRAFT_1655610 [Desarmillaria tabescens]
MLHVHSASQYQIPAACSVSSESTLVAYVDVDDNPFDNAEDAATMNLTSTFIETVTYEDSAANEPYDMTQTSWAIKATEDEAASSAIETIGFQTHAPADPPSRQHEMQQNILPPPTKALTVQTNEAARKSFFSTSASSSSRASTPFLPNTPKNFGQSDASEARAARESIFDTSASRSSSHSSTPLLTSTPRNASFFSKSMTREVKRMDSRETTPGHAPKLMLPPPPPVLHSISK